MKTLSVIFCSFIICTQALPLAELVWDVEIFEHCCSDSDSESNHSTNEAGDDCCGSCNPFTACNGCHGFNVPSEFMPRLTISAVQEQTSFYVSSYSNWYRGSIWNPPQA